jgi:hypothetical protein
MLAPSAKITFNAAMPLRDRILTALLAIGLTRADGLSQEGQDRLIQAFTPEDYIGQGDAWYCGHFASQAQAQA